MALTFIYHSSLVKQHYKPEPHPVNQSESSEVSSNKLSLRDELSASHAALKKNVNYYNCYTLHISQCKIACSN